MLQLETIDAQRSIYVISMGVLLGSTFYTTFVAGPIQFKTLPKLVFGNLQSKQFPIYFFLQSALSLYLWWGAGAISPLLVDGWNQKSWLLSLACSVLNLIIIGPLSTKIMFQRHALVKKDKKVPKDLNIKFSILHGISSTLNLVTLIVCIGNSVWLGGKLNI